MSEADNGQFRTTYDFGSRGSGGPLSDVGTVSISVTPHTVPFAASDFFDVEEDSSQNQLNVLDNDMRPDPRSDNSLTITLSAILAEWSSSRDFATRVQNLTVGGDGDRLNGDNFLVTGDTVVDDLIAVIIEPDEVADFIFD